ncbi:MAG: exopolysaccharide biosynthesis GT4 family glycosyltransferase EpsE [Pseudomonadota bacterium]
MKIGYLVPEFPGQTHAFFWREILALEARGHHVEIFSTRPPPTKLKSHAWTEHAVGRTTYLSDVSKAGIAALGGRALTKLHKVSIKSADIRDLSDAKDLFATLVFGLRLGELMRSLGVKHVHTHSCARSALIALFAKQFCGTTYSITLHGFLKDYGSLQRLKWRNAAFATIITREIRDETLQDLAGDLPPEIKLQPMGVDTTKFTRREPYQPWRPGKPFEVFCCARLNRVKGHITLLEAVRKLTSEGLDIRLTIAGEDDLGGDGYRKVIEQAIVDLEISDRVALMGAVSEDVVLDRLTNSHVFALASHREPLGVAYMEAMSCDTPVIGTDAGGVPELIENEVDGLLIAPKDPEQLAGALRKIADNPDFAGKLADAGRRKVEHHFSADRGAETLIEAISTLYE